MECPKCYIKYHDRHIQNNIIKKHGMCESCYVKGQPLVEVLDGKGGYVPWEYNNFVHSDGGTSNNRHWVENDSGNQGMLADHTLPEISFCEIRQKWKIKYVGADCYVNGNNAIDIFRYFDTLKQLLEALGVSKGVHFPTGE